MTCLREAATAKAGCHDFAEEEVFSVFLISELSISLLSEEHAYDAPEINTSVQRRHLADFPYHGGIR
jgi:hypothetical protein